MTNLDPLVEKVLLEKLRDGDTEAFSTFFSAYYPDLVMFAVGFTNELASAEEIVQDTFVKLWEEHEVIHIHISLKSYLLKSVQNKCIDWHRHLKVMHSHNANVNENAQLYTYDIDNYVLHSELEDQIEVALSKLPEEISEVYRMNRYEGFKYHEIAEKLKVSIRTIEVRMGKALHLLREYLKDYLTIIIVIWDIAFTQLFMHRFY